MEAKTYTSVHSAVRDIVGDDAANDLRDRLRSRRLVKALAAMRAARGLCQSDVADELGCSQSRVSKIENGIDNDLRVGELEAYAKAVDCEISLHFTNRNETTFGRIKRQVISIHRDLCHLADLAHKDEEIAKGVAKTFGEVLVNQLNLLRLAAKQLPNNPETDEPYINIELEIGVGRDESPIECDDAGALEAESPTRAATPVAV